MRPRDILRTTVFAALAAAPLVAATAQSASAQKVVAATCPKGYALSGSNCIQNAPAPAAKSSTGSQWAFITRKTFGVKTATELDGANFCAVTGSTSADDANDFFKENDLPATLVKVDSDRAGIEKYQKYDCDVLVVANQVANATADSLKPAGDHLVLPEKFGSLDAAPEPAVAPTPLPPKAPATVQQQSKPMPKKTARKKRCSAVRYGYSRGNTCGCAGGRVFNGRSCVRPRW